MNYTHSMNQQSNTLFWRIFGYIFHYLVHVLELYYHRHIPHILTVADIDRLNSSQLLWRQFDNRLRSYITAYGFWDSIKVDTIIIDDDHVRATVQYFPNITFSDLVKVIVVDEYTLDVAYHLRKLGVSHDRSNYLSHAYSADIEYYINKRLKPSEAAYMINEVTCQL